MKPFSLSFRAEYSLDQIGAYSRENFGRERGETYVVALMERCHMVASGQLPTQSCRSAFGESLRSDLRFTRSGRHIIIFVDMPTEILIVDFIHQSADIGARLEGPRE